MATPILVPPPPYKTPLTDEEGYLAQAWIAWFRQLFLRAGGESALSNTDLATVQTLDLTSLEADVATLQASLSNLQDSVTEQESDIADLDVSVNGLGQGPNL